MAKTATVPKTVEGQIVHSEILTNDAPRLRKFMEKNFGWEFQTLRTSLGEYHLFHTPGGTRGGIGEPRPGETIGGIPYVVVDDVRATAQKLKKAGAEIVMGPTEVPGGSMVHFRLEGGPVLACWEYAPESE